MMGTRRRAQLRRLRNWNTSLAFVTALSTLLLLDSTNPGQTTERIGLDSRPPIPPHLFKGVASYYGNESGRQTASGQRFDENALTAAHLSLPFGTKLKVTHDGRSVIVTVNDRGPYVKGRVLDLSTAAARAIGLTSRGVGMVVAEVM
jgi:rare lipoprotein A